MISPQRATGKLYEVIERIESYYEQSSTPLTYFKLLDAREMTYGEAESFYHIVVPLFEFNTREFNYCNLDEIFVGLGKRHCRLTDTSIVYDGFLSFSRWRTSQGKFIIRASDGIVYELEKTTLLYLQFRRIDKSLAKARIDLLKQMRHIES